MGFTGNHNDVPIKYHLVEQHIKLIDEPMGKLNIIFSKPGNFS
jgi:hypothetical protein